MLACPLFREFHKPNKTVKLNINCNSQQDKITTVFRIVWFQFAKIILHAKSPTFSEAKLQGFTEVKPDYTFVNSKHSADSQQIIFILTTTGIN